MRLQYGQLRKPAPGTCSERLLVSGTCILTCTLWYKARRGRPDTDGQTRTTRHGRPGERSWSARLCSRAQVPTRRAKNLNAKQSVFLEFFPGLGPRRLAVAHDAISQHALLAFFCTPPRRIATVHSGGVGKRHASAVCMSLCLYLRFCARVRVRPWPDGCACFFAWPMFSVSAVVLGGAADSAAATPSADTPCGSDRRAPALHATSEAVCAHSSTRAGGGLLCHARVCSRAKRRPCAQWRTSRTTALADSCCALVADHPFATSRLIFVCSSSSTFLQSQRVCRARRALLKQCTNA